MKKPWVAFLLNFLLPGAGLAYLGKWGWAVLNFAAVLILAFILASAVPPDSLGAVSAGLGAASGSLAMSVAGGINAKANARRVAANPAWQPPPAPPPPPSGPAPVNTRAAVPNAKFCGSCGAQTTGSKFCGKCGSPISAANRCPACGFVLDEPSQFCTECGHSMA